MAAASYVYRRQGRIADAIRKQEEALDHDPRNPRFVANQAANYMMVRRYADADRERRHALALEPAHATDQVGPGSPILRRPCDPVPQFNAPRGAPQSREPARAARRGGASA